MENKRSSNLRWLAWAREIQALAQTGNYFAENDWQRGRYFRLMEIAAEIVNAHTLLPIEGLVKNFQNQPGYATPKIDVRGAVFRDERILLVKERVNGEWTMPGGWVDVGDTPSGSIEREVFEESGFRVEAVKLIGVYDANRVDPLEFFHAFKIIFLCEIVAGEARTSNETSDVRFFSEGDYPNDFPGERTRLRHLKDAFAAFRDPSTDVFFD